jgi:hypothetical protein
VFVAGPAAALVETPSLLWPVIEVQQGAYQP